MKLSLTAWMGYNGGVVKWIQNIRTAVGYFKRARQTALDRNQQRAEAGDVNAQYSLAERYFDGLGVEQDFGQAFYWFQQAARQGHAKAQFNVGMMHLLGRGVPKDVIEGYQWIYLAAQRDNDAAQDLLNSLSRKLTQEQIDEGRRRAEVLSPQIASSPNTESEKP